MKLLTHKLYRYIIPLCIFTSLWVLTPTTLHPGNLENSSDNEFSVPDYRMKNFRYISTENNKKEIELYAAEANYFLKKQYLRSSHTVAYIYNEKGEKTEVTSNKGLFMIKDRYLELSGDVNSISQDSFRLAGEKIQYNINKRKISIPNPFSGELESQKLKISANSGSLDLNANTIAFQGRVSIVYKDPSHGIMSIKAQKTNLYRDQYRLVCTERVRLRQNKIKLSSDTLSLSYNSKLRSGRKGLKYMRASGNVIIKDNRLGYSRSQEAEFSRSTDAIVLKGHPSLYSKKGTVTGDTLILHRSTGVIEVKSTNASITFEGKKK